MGGGFPAGTVCWYDGENYTYNDDCSDRWCHIGGCCLEFPDEVATEAEPEAKTWASLSDEEKGLLLLAHHEGKAIQYNSPCDSCGWWDEHDFRPNEFPLFIYRVKPELVVTEVCCYGSNSGIFGFDFEEGFAEGDTHKITFNLIDGEPDCDSIKMERI